MRTKILVLLFAIALVSSANLYAQVSIGGLEAPATGALLDLNKTVKGGLALSVVDLPNFQTIPNGFPGITSQTDVTVAVKSGFRGALVYNTGVTTPPAGIYVWNGTNWAPVEENCLPADSLTVSLITPVVIAKTGDPVTFSVSTGVGARCAEGETYDWYQAVAANAYGAAAYTTVYPLSSKSIAFSPANTYKVKVEVSNIYSASAKARSNEVTVYVTDGGGVPAALYHVNYDVSGAPCYDVYRSSTEPEPNYTARADSFANGKYEKTYSFDYKGAYSDLQVNYEDPHGLVDHIIQPANTSNVAAFGKEPFTVVFKSGVKTSVPVSGRDTVKLWISYKVGTEAKFALRNIRVQDAACHCPARIDRLSDRWLTFACHNLGGLDITSSSQTLTYQHHGDWYRWGAKTASVVNTGTNNGGQGWTSSNPDYQEPSEDDSAQKDAAGNNLWKAENNPCPAGWRLPDINELNINRDALADLGAWSDGNFSSCLKVGDYLYLPAAGGRNSSYGSLYERGFHGTYWSSSASISTSGEAMAMHLHNGYRNVDDNDRTYGFSVRCVAVE
jgi:uncharacterized protein (TIGR02145 family)